MKIFSYLLIKIIKVYQLIISPYLGNNCRYLPTCSEYFIDCLNEYGFELADDIDYTFDNDGNFELYIEQVLKLISTDTHKYSTLASRNKSIAKRLYEENYNEYVTNKPISDEDKKAAEKLGIKFDPKP